MSSGWIFFIVVVGMFAGVFLLAVGVKWWEVRQAAKWPSAPGTVVANFVQSMQNQPGELAYNFSDTEVRNIPMVEYEFHVGSRKYRGNRITIGERTSGHELEAILGRYPVGAEVTVYYDPANPEKAVLERDVPGWIWWVAGGCILAIVGVPLLGVFFYYQGLDWLRPHLRHPDRAPFVTAAAGFGLLVSLFGIAFFKWVRQASRWPTTSGRIVASGVDVFRYRAPDDRIWRTHHKSNVVYEYEVNGRRFLGDRLILGVTFSSTHRRVIDSQARHYPVGREVLVYYDPKNPGESVLQPRSAWHYLLWIIAAAIFALAWWVGMG
jgi:hypothetical protein